MLTVDLTAPPPVPVRAAFRAAPGTVAALFGPSGAGKTTLLRMLAGFHPAAGTLIWAGENWIGHRAWERPMGYVAQDTSLFPHWTVARQVAEAARRPPDDAQVAALLDAVGLSRLRDRRPRELSGGQQQRAALARALARQPAWLLLDEPLAHLDQAARRDLSAWLVEEVHTRHLVAIMATHDWDEVERLADEVLVMDQEQVLVQGSPMEVFQEPRSARAARLLGYRAVINGRALHPDRAEWRDPGRASLILRGTVRSFRPGHLGTLVTAEGPEGTWQALWTGPGSPNPGQVVEVGFYAPEVALDDR